MLTGKRLLFTLITLISFILFQSQLSAAEDLNIDPLTNISVSKDDILKSMDSLKKQGKISEEDYQKAKKELMGLSDAQINGIKDTAINMVKKDPDKATELINKNKIDFKQVEKQAVEVTPKK